jgi:hypothetical protein
MGKKASGGKQQVADYYLSIHYGVCHGPVDAVTGIFIKEKLAWTAAKSEPQRVNGPIVVNKMELFGGVKKEGGAIGEAYAYLGGPEQRLTAAHAAKYGVPAERMPGYRGLLTVFFDQGSQGWGGSYGGFYWGSNNPYLPGAWIRVTRIAKGLSPATATLAPASAGGPAGYWKGTIELQPKLKSNGFAWGIQHWEWIGVGPHPDYPRDEENNLPNPDGGYCVTSQIGQPIFPTCVVTDSEDDSQLYPDANPAHMIFECLTDPDWGMGAPTTLIDMPNFEAVAQTLFNEGFGLSMLWTKQASIEDFVSEILDHIQAALFIHPRTGLFTLKLFRGDYLDTALREINPDNANLTSYQVKAASELVNEIVVTWTNPVNEKEQTITYQLLGEIAMAGAVISDTRNYYGCRNDVLASRLAVRDLRTASQALITAEVELDRRAWDLVPGDVVRMSWPIYGVASVTMRATSVEYGEPGNPKIAVKLTQDVFALRPATYTTPQKSIWTNPAEDPNAFPFIHVFTIPYPMLANLPDIADNAGENYPAVYAGILTAPLGTDYINFDLYGEVTLGNGTVQEERLGTKRMTGHGFVPVALAAEAETKVTFGPVTGGSGPVVGGFVMIGDEADEITEICLLDGVENGVWTLARGALDTVPRAWPVLSPVWFIGTDWNAYDPIERTGGAPVDYKMQGRTSKGTLAIADVPIITTTLTERPYLPFRPANIEVGGVRFGRKVYANAPLNIPVTWSTRNRTMEDAVARRWNDAPVVPEEGQTMTVIARDALGVEIDREEGLTGNSAALRASILGGRSLATLYFYAEKDGDLSLQAHSIEIQQPGTGGGYGLSYGQDYGD